MTEAGDQDETIRFLERAVAVPGEDAVRIPTHASLVFLAGGRAFKLKRAVRYPYLDFSTPEKRLASCRAEIDLNRRTAPRLYLGVRSINRSADGGLAFDGSGPLVDAVVEMRRFSDDALFDSMAQRGALTPALMTVLARRIATFHREAAVSTLQGGAAGMAAVLDINDRSLRRTGVVPPEAAEAFAALFRQALDRHAALLDRRRDAGKVRRCHGDLILRNICLFEGEPTPFDCLEFDEALATTDILYDLAFLLMDLWRRDLRDLANGVFNRYCDEADETDGLMLLPFFMAVRAAVRAHVTAAAGAQGEEATLLKAEVMVYFDLAKALLRTPPPLLLAIGGFSGSGKSTAAAQVAPQLGPAPGARVLASDRIRKRLHGLAAEARLPEAAYRPEVSETVYAILRREAAATLAQGYAVVADAVFDRPGEREAIEDRARAAGIPFQGFWLEAPEAALLSRLAARRNDPSDANAAVLAAQLRRDCGTIGWRRIDASGGPAQTGRAILSALTGA